MGSRVIYYFVNAKGRTITIFLYFPLIRVSAHPWLSRNGGTGTLHCG